CSNDTLEPAVNFFCLLAGPGAIPRQNSRGFDRISPLTSLPGNVSTISTLYLPFPQPVVPPQQVPLSDRFMADWPDKAARFPHGVVGDLRRLPVRLSRVQGSQGYWPEPCRPLLAPMGPPVDGPLRPAGPTVALGLVASLRG